MAVSTPSEWRNPITIPILESMTRNIDIVYKGLDLGQHSGAYTRLESVRAQQMLEKAVELMNVLKASKTEILAQKTLESLSELWAGYVPLLDKANLKGCFNMESSARLWNSCQGLISVKDLLVQTRQFTDGIADAKPVKPSVEPVADP